MVYTVYEKREIISFCVRLNTEAKMKKIAIIGCGSMGLLHLNNILKSEKDITLAGFADPIPERAEALASLAGEGEFFTNAEKMLDETSPDMVFISVPPYCHGELEAACIERKIPFFVDSPIALDLGVAEKIRDAAEDAGIITAVGFDMRYSALTMQAAKFCAENDIVGISCTDIGSANDAFWMRDCELSGGRIVSHTMHHLDTLRYIFGEPEEAFAYSTRGFVQGIANYANNDAAAGVIRFENGTAATLSVGCYAETEAAAHSKLTFSGTHMGAELSPNHRFEIFGEVADGEENIFLDDGDSPAECDRAFIEAVITGERELIRSSYADAVKSLKFALAINKSLATGEKVKI